jgi:Alpha/beta hydrolase domain
MRHPFAIGTTWSNVAFVCCQRSCPLVRANGELPATFGDPMHFSMRRGRSSKHLREARTGGHQLPNPTPQDSVPRGLLRAWHEWASSGTLPPPSQYPRLSDRTLVSIDEVHFPALKGVADPRQITGRARMIDGRVIRLPHLAPQVDRDGNDIAGIHDPEIAVPLATTTGWNFRDPSVGNPQDIYQLLGSYIPFARTRGARQANADPRLSLAERYRGIDDYLQRIRSSAMELIRRRYVLGEDLDSILERAKTHWSFATRDDVSRAADGR